MFFGKKITEYRDEIFNDIAEIVAIPSVRGDALANMPFGEESTKALQWILNRAQEMGIKTKNIKNMAGHAEIGNYSDYIATLTHVDVVGGSTGWKTNPFTATEIDGKLYGRGVSDDKGAAIVTLYCLKILKDEKVPIKRSVRTIFGAGEETGMEDMQEYFSSQPLPKWAFTPDSDYPICNCEKGILQLKLKKESVNPSNIIVFKAGDTVNAVPDFAEIELIYNENLFKQLSSLQKSDSKRLLIEKDSDKIKIKCIGHSAHAMCPEKGNNSATYLINKLLPYLDGGTPEFMEFMSQRIFDEHNGALLDIECSDNVSGKLTINPSCFEVSQNNQSFTLDIRYPATKSGEQIIKKISEVSYEYGFNLEVLSHLEPIYIKEDSPLISTLACAYETVTGTTAKLYSTGGGTYARALHGRGVAFGPFEQDEDTRLHQSNECIDMNRFMIHAQICLEAMYQLAIAD